MSLESLKVTEGAAIQLYETLEARAGVEENPLFGSLVQGASGSYYIVLGIVRSGPRIDQGLKAYSLEPSFPDTPTLVTIPWAARIILLSGQKKSAIASRFRNKIESIRNEYNLSPTTQNQ
jgi:hypothetical protein